jgi:hypothetical protein
MGVQIDVCGSDFPKGTNSGAEAPAAQTGATTRGKVRLAEEEGRLVLTPVPSDPIEAATGFVFSSLSLQEATIPDRNQQFVHPVDTRSRNPGLGRILLKWQHRGDNP